VSAESSTFDDLTSMQSSLRWSSPPRSSAPPKAIVICEYDKNGEIDDDSAAGTLQEDGSLNGDGKDPCKGGSLYVSQYTGKYCCY
jgi:hypothetical protein